ncbi:MAG: cupin-like domain-containing protein [Micromonosporaceae bacterium]
MSTVAAGRPIDVRGPLSPDDFYGRYVGREPLVMRGAVAELPAVERWSMEYFASLAPDAQVQLKTGSVAAGQTTTMRLADYAQAVTDWEKRAADLDGSTDDAGDRPPYLHDLPLLSIIPQLRDDISGFQVELLPAFFRSRWWDFTQFFVGPSGAVTPLHFDTLLTHNLFLQIKGSKRFVIVENRDRSLCYLKGWRWSSVDPEDPDLERYPLFRDAEVRTCVVGAGDLLYMPPGTLHKVVSETPSMSFNIDWHDWRSALRGVAAVRHGMPVTNLRYNLTFALGVIGRVPSSVLLPALRSYFSYIS